MELVIISDTHNRHHKLEIPKGDVLIHCGDVCHGTDDFDNKKTITDFCEWMSKLDFKCKILTAGNHDTVLEDDDLCIRMVEEHMTYLYDKSCEFEGLKFFGSPWTIPMYGAFNAEEWAIEDYTNKCKKCDVLITHSPPYGILDKSRTGSHTGSSSIKNLCERVNPAVHCFGHCHNQGGKFECHKDIMYINAARSLMTFSLDKR